MRKNLLIALVILSFLSSCGIGREARKARRADVKHAYQIELLFEYDGCKIYKFFDFERGYFFKCDGETIKKTDSTETRKLNKSSQ
jgi:hypothetical protein